MPDNLIDFTGTHHLPAGPAPRIVSLVPSLTELLFDLGLGKHIVGRTNFCIHPHTQVKSIASVGGTKKINMEKLMALAPTHAIVNVDETPKELADELAKPGLNLIVTHPGCPADNLELFRLLGAIFNRQERAEELCHEFRLAMTRLLEAPPIASPSRILYLIWNEPWMTVSQSTYISRTLALINWQTVADNSEIRYPELEITQDLLSEVDIVLFSTEPYPFKPVHLSDFHKKFPDYTGQSALIDAEMVSWYGSRAIAGLPYLRSFAKGLAR